LFLYNTITNKESFGGTRATNFFKKYIHKTNSLARNYYKFQTIIESDNEFLNKIEQYGLDNKDNSFRNLVYFSLFGKSLGKNKGKQAILKKGKNDNMMDDMFLQSNVESEIILNNKYYTLPYNVIPNENNINIEKRK